MCNKHGKESSGNVKYIGHKGKPHRSQKYPANMQSHSQPNTQHSLHPPYQERSNGFPAASKFPSSHSLKIKAFLVAGDSWGLQKATAGLLLEENHEGRRRRRITGNTGRPANLRASGEGDPSPKQAGPSLKPQPVPPYKLCELYLFCSPKIMSSGH